MVEGRASASRGQLAYARTVQVGDGSGQGSRLDPVNNRPQYDRVLELMRDARAHGYNFLLGGEDSERPGYYVPITIIDNPPEHSRIVQEEQFGPVLPLLRFTDIDDVVARANASDYGLGARVWGTNEDATWAVAERIASGNETQHLTPLATFGGMKQSGLGVENGTEGLLEHSCAQTISRRR